MYHTWGVSLSLVEVDLLSGDYKILRTEIVQDCGGPSLNPAIDIGQIEGGFMTGVGLYTLEELIFDEKRDGHLRTRNVSTYKIPTHDDIPLQFNVHLFEKVKNNRGVS